MGGDILMSNLSLKMCFSELWQVLIVGFFDPCEFAIGEASEIIGTTRQEPTASSHSCL